MIVGVVTSTREPIVRLSVQGNGTQQEVTTLLDTGFSGSLTLPPDIVTALGLPYRSRGSAILADGSTIDFDMHAAVVIWDGSPRPVLIEVAVTEPLLGMALLYGHDIHIEAIDGGAVTVQRRLP